MSAGDTDVFLMETCRWINATTSGTLKGMPRKACGEQELSLFSMLAGFYELGKDYQQPRALYRSKGKGKSH